MTYNIDLSNIEQLMTPKGYEMLKVESRYLLSYGGSGSSKSYSATQKIIFRILTEKNHRILLLRKTASSLKKSVYQLLQDVISDWGINDLFMINKTDMSFLCKANGNQIVLSGLDDVEKLKSIAGISVIWVEEATEITSDDFDQLNLRLRGHTKSYKQIILTFNPVSSQSWIKKRFFDSNIKNATIVHSTFEDNPFLDDEYKDILYSLAGQNQSYYDIYALGKWRDRKGLIFPDYKLVDELPKEYDFETFGIDFGYNHPQTLVQTRTVGNNVYFKELFYESETLVDDLIDCMNENNISKSAKIYADSANPDKIVMIQNAGYKKCVGAKKDVLAGIDFMKSKKIYITKDSANLIKEIESYSWKLNKNGEAMEQPVKFLDDILDGCRYSIFRREKFNTFSTQVTDRKRDDIYDGFDDKDINLHQQSKDTFTGY